MQYGICNLGVIPLRQEASDKSEMVSQVLFGEHFKIIIEQKNWSKIKLYHDNYEGWIDNKQLLKISKEKYNNLHDSQYLTSDILSIALHSEAKQIILPMGSTLPFFSENNFHIGDNIFSFEGNICNTKNIQSKIYQTALTFLNTPYLWGGKTHLGIDCSGFTQMVYKLNGIQLYRDVNQQVTQGQTLNFLEEAKAGDLAFFDNDEGKIIHVGIILNDNKIIHTSGKVKIDHIDHMGIYTKETKTHSHQLRILKTHL